MFELFSYFFCFTCIHKINTYIFIYLFLDKVSGIASLSLEYGVLRISFLENKQKTGFNLLTLWTVFLALTLCSSCWVDAGLFIFFVAAHPFENALWFAYICGVWNGIGSDRKQTMCQFHSESCSLNDLMDAEIHVDKSIILWSSLGFFPHFSGGRLLSVLFVLAPRFSPEMAFPITIVEESSVRGRLLVMHCMYLTVEY